MTEQDLLYIAERLADRLYHEGLIDWDNSGTSFDSFSKKEVVEVISDILSAEISIDTEAEYE